MASVPVVASPNMDVCLDRRSSEKYKNGCSVPAYKPAPIAVHLAHPALPRLESNPPPPSMAVPANRLIGSLSYTNMNITRDVIIVDPLIPPPGFVGPAMHCCTIVQTPITRAVVYIEVQLPGGGWAYSALATVFFLSIVRVFGGAPPLFVNVALQPTVLPGVGLALVRTMAHHGKYRWQSNLPMPAGLPSLLYYRAPSAPLVLRSFATLTFEPQWQACRIAA
ncbi:hypothetical protein K466DRAFT_606828 [Polyporus arcularius HHB13444]|uniref:Uncharacterized protein n=1 Tax=Polyporus arcularius HHB13444 TaxID=1314778 RepID=A0A5C3NPJ4_9APHY|nr:hypothetical protein K466DRAFT_606828 [Polyporus arcularius HHB13444]